MNTLKALVVYVLMLIAAITDSKKMQSWLDGILDESEG